MTWHPESNYFLAIKTIFILKNIVVKFLNAILISRVKKSNYSVPVLNRKKFSTNLTMFLFKKTSKISFQRTKNPLWILRKKTFLNMPKIFLPKV
jgi:hypothetical protein